MQKRDPKPIFHSCHEMCKYNIWKITNIALKFNYPLPMRVCQFHFSSSWRYLTYTFKWKLVNDPLSHNWCACWGHKLLNICRKIPMFLCWNIFLINYYFQVLHVIIKKRLIIENIFPNLLWYLYCFLWCNMKDLCFHENTFLELLLYKSHKSSMKYVNYINSLSWHTTTIL